MENVLVTGAAGFIGLNMIKHLSCTECCMYAMLLKNDIKGINKIKKISKKILIITDSIDELIQNAEKYPRFDKVYHFATVGVRPEFNDITLICDVNIKMGCQLVDFAFINKTRLLINVGSCFEYGTNDGAPLNENSRCNPESLYAISKNAAVNLMTAYAKAKGVAMFTARPFGVFGSGEGMNRLAPLIIWHGLNHKYLKLTGGEQIRDFVDVKDIVKCIYQLSCSDRIKIYEIYNICSNYPVMVKDFVLEIINVLDLDKSFFGFGKLPYRDNEDMCFIGDNSKLMNTINYKFPENHQSGIIDLYDEIKLVKDMEKNK